MNDYLINGVESSWEDVVKLARKKKLANVDKSTIACLTASLARKGYKIIRIPQDTPELL